MKKIISCLIITLLISCGKATVSDSPSTAIAVVQRFLAPDHWENASSYLAPYLSSIDATLGEDFAKNEKKGKFSYRSQQDDGTTAYIAAEYRSNDESYNIYFELHNEDGYWKIYSVLGLPQSSEAQMEYYNIQQLLSGDKELEANLADSFTDSPLLFTLEQQLKNIGYVASLDRNLLRMLKKDSKKITALINNAEEQDDQVIFAFKDSENRDIAQQLADLSFIAIDISNKDDLTGEKPTTILVGRSLENMLFILHEKDTTKLPPLGGNIVMVEKIGTNLFAVKSINAYQSSMGYDHDHYEGDGHEH